jgi:predicted 3-demethylubiquinone-9 3-methyltransferase (glyoxalase superfamily)
MQKIVPCLWFNIEAEAAARFYTSIFKNSRILETTHYGEDGPGTKGFVLTVRFLLDGEEFLALNGGPEFKFTEAEAVSFVVNCDTQQEIDRFWEQLSEGGQEVECGWLKDKFGLSWQVLPTILPELIADRDPAKRDRVMKALMQMKKLDIAALEDAAQGTYADIANLSL